MNLTFSEVQKGKEKKDKKRFKAELWLKSNNFSLFFMVQELTALT